MYLNHSFSSMVFLFWKPTTPSNPFQVKLVYSGMLIFFYEEITYNIKPHIKAVFTFILFVNIRKTQLW